VWIPYPKLDTLQDWIPAEVIKDATENEIVVRGEVDLQVSLDHPRDFLSSLTKPPFIKGKNFTSFSCLHSKPHHS
jgi:hypothetical protein